VTLAYVELSGSHFVTKAAAASILWSIMKSGKMR